jgi:hypothetical protein
VRRCAPRPKGCSSCCAQTNRNREGCGWSGTTVSVNSC